MAALLGIRQILFPGKGCRFLVNLLLNLLNFNLKL